MVDEKSPEKNPKKQKVSFLSRIFVPVGTVVGVRYIKDGASLIKNVASRLLTPMKSEHNETFEEAATRLRLTEAQLETQQKDYFWQSMLFFGISLALILFSLYRLYLLEIVAGLLGLFLSGVSLSYAFRANFWYFQIKNRKLGCTFAEWWAGEIKTNENKKPQKNT